MQDKVVFVRRVKEIGGSIATVIPKELLVYLELKPEDEIVMTADNGRYGKFVSFWKKTEEKEDEKK